MVLINFLQHLGKPRSSFLRFLFLKGIILSAKISVDARTRQGTDISTIRSQNDSFVAVYYYCNCNNSFVKSLKVVPDSLSLGWRESFVLDKYSKAVPHCDRHLSEIHDFPVREEMLMERRCWVAVRSMTSAAAVAERTARV